MSNLISAVSLGLGATPSSFSRFRPANLPGAILGYSSRHHVSISANPLAAGVTPQAVTFGGTRLDLTDVPAVLIVIDGTGIVGTATFKISVDGGLSFPVIGQTVQSSITFTTPTYPSIINNLVANFPAGTYTLGDTYTARTSVIVGQGSATGGAKNLVASTTAKQPIIAWNAGGMPVIRFDGVANTMKCTAAEVIQVEQIFALFKSNSANTSGGAGTYFDGVAGNLMRLFRSAAAALSMTSDGANTIVSSAVTPQAFHVWEIGFNAANSYGKQDNVQVLATGNAGAGNGGGLTIGTFGDGVSGPIDMDFIELWGFNPALSAANTTAMYDYMAAIKARLV